MDASKKPSPAITYFIDESGNTGDLITAGDKLEFGNQPYFGLGCIGVTDVDGFEKKVINLKNKHNIQSNDLKSTKIYKNKPKFILDLIKLIAGDKIPFFVELVEKKFFIATNISFYLVWPPYFNIDDHEASNNMRNFFAQLITKNAPDDVFSSYFKACIERTKESLMAAFQALLNFGHSQPTDPIYQGFVKCINESIDDFELMIKEENSVEVAVKRFLPLPDTGKKGKEFWILPNYSSLTNLYARINHAHEGKIANIHLVHDEQAQYDEILDLAKKATEMLRNAREVSPVANYNFLEKASLTFAKSEDNIGIQAADVLIGFLVRYAQEILCAKTDPTKELKEAFRIMAEAENYEKGYGVNYVWSHNEIRFA